VAENKAHHFFEWRKLCAFCAQITTNYALKGAKTAQLAQNEVRAFEPQGEAGQMTRSRLQRAATHEPTALSRGEMAFLP
jgi:hypothetical protein